MDRDAQAASREASRKASEWFVFLQDDPEDASLRRRFEAWLNASPAHEAAWSETLRTSSLAEALLPFDAKDWERSRVAPVRRPRLWRWFMPLTAGAVAVVVAALSAPAVLLHLQSDFTTGTAQIRQIDLEDGSRVTLAADSAIAVAYAETKREVRLLAGEAYFSVMPDPRRPFHVTADFLTASVLGTSFNVDLQRDSVSVSVAEGRVQVSSPGIQEVLEAGQDVRVSAGQHVAQRGNSSPQAMAAWRQGQLILEDAPFGKALDRLDRYFSGSILVIDGGLRERPVTGIFNLNEPEAALQTIARALGAKVRRVSPWLLIVSAA